MRVSWAPLAKIGTYSYAIYLLHVFGSAGSRLAIGQFGISTPLAVFAISLAAGVALPIVAELIVDRNRWLRFLILGRRFEPALRAGGAQPGSRTATLAGDPPRGTREALS